MFSSNKDRELRENTDEVSHTISELPQNSTNDANPQGRAYKAERADVVEATRSRPPEKHEWLSLFGDGCVSRVWFRCFS